MPYHPAGALIAELCSALCTAASKYLAAVLGGHSLAEAVLLGALALLRLVCSKHDWHLPELLLNITKVKQLTFHILCRSCLRTRGSLLYTKKTIDVNKINDIWFRIFCKVFHYYCKKPLIGI